MSAEANKTVADATATSVQQAGGGQPSGQQVSLHQVTDPILSKLEAIFKHHGGHDGKKWSKEQIVRFMHQVQADQASRMAERDELDLDGFVQYMMSPEADLVGPSVDQDFSWPLSSYFISSSHNTYLTGNQLYSHSSTDAYTNVLLRACRCIEIDVWDGDDSDSGTSESGSSDEELAEKRAMGKASRKERLARKVPASISRRLQKTSLGKKLEKLAGKEPVEVEAAPPAAGPSDKALTSEPAGPRAVAVEPRVLHGYTLTKEVSFRDVCEAIRDSAFSVSDLPLIVSLEVHCSAQQQEVMVEIMKDVFGDMMLTRAAGDSIPKVLPSPAELRKKILVKVKYAPPQGDTAEAEGAPATSPEAAAKKQSSKPCKIIHALSQLGIYTKGVSFKSLEQPEAEMPTHIFSLSEKTVMEVHQRQAPILFRHNQQYMMRTYPSGMRIGSSNLDPSIFWRKGIQIVALNWQNWDEGMMLNEGMFAGTGGYVLKPEGYRGAKSPGSGGGGLTTTTTTTRCAGGPDIQHEMLDLKVTVFAAQNLPLPEEDDRSSGFRPYVKMELHTEPHHDLALRLAREGNAPEAEFKARTRTLKGVSPDWEGDVLGFGAVAGVVAPLAFVRFTVRDDELCRDDLAAWACVRLDRLQSGYRFIRFMDKEGVLSSGVLLVKVEKTLTQMGR